MSSRNDPYDEVTRIYTDDAYVDKENLAGSEIVVRDFDPDDLTKNLSNRSVTYRLMKNTSGSALVSGKVVRRVTTSLTTMTEEVTECDASNIPLGVINNFVPTAGVANNAWSYVVVGGPVNAIADGTHSAGNRLKTAADGEVATNGGTVSNFDFAIALEDATAGQEKRIDIY